MSDTNDKEKSVNKTTEEFGSLVPTDHPDNYLAYQIITEIYEGWGKPEKAKEYRELIRKK